MEFEQPLICPCFKFGGEMVPAEEEDGDSEAIPDDPPLLSWPVVLYHEESEYSFEWPLFPLFAEEPLIPKQ